MTKRTNDGSCCCGVGDPCQCPGACFSLPRRWTLVVTNLVVGGCDADPINGTFTLVLPPLDGCPAYQTDSVLLGDPCFGSGPTWSLWYDEADDEWHLYPGSDDGRFLPIPKLDFACCEEFDWLEASGDVSWGDATIVLTPADDCATCCDPGTLNVFGFSYNPETLHTCDCLPDPAVTDPLLGSLTYNPANGHWEGSFDWGTCGPVVSLSLYDDGAGNVCVDWSFSDDCAGPDTYCFPVAFPCTPSSFTFLWNISSTVTSLCGCDVGEEFAGYIEINNY